MENQNFTEEDVLPLLEFSSRCRRRVLVCECPAGYFFGMLNNSLPFKFSPRLVDALELLPVAHREDGSCVVNNMLARVSMLKGQPIPNKLRGRVLVRFSLAQISASEGHKKDASLPYSLP